MMALADDENAETAISQALKALDEIPVTIDPEVLLTRADLGLYRGQAAEARELIGQLRALGPDVEIEPARIACTEMKAALMLGDTAAATASRDEVLAGLYPALTMKSHGIDWLARRLRATDAVGADLAIKWQADIKRATAEAPTRSTLMPLPRSMRSMRRSRPQP